MTRCTCHDTLVIKNLNRWFKEKWVDVSRKNKDGKHPPCGRSKASKSSKGYPKCRPSVKVSSKTPKTSGSMSSGQKQAATKRKRAKKQGVGGKPTVVKAMKDKKDMKDMKGKKGMVMVIAISAKPKKVGVKKKSKVKKAEVCRNCGMQFEPDASRFFGTNPNASLCPNCEYHKGFSGYYTGE